MISELINTHSPLDTEQAAAPKPKNDGLKIMMISLHGLVRGDEMELGRDADTGGQVKYVVELARELAESPGVREVELLTRQIRDPNIDESYAQIEEALAENAKIIRIPFGPKRYLKKESLWPYLEMFVDQTLQHVRRNGVPDIIHGHYADAGYAGSQLARLLHVPFIFTGHSLGRVKKQRLLVNKSGEEQEKSLEKKYKLKTRTEAEEVALETASMVVTSTNQEVTDQYELYDHYEPSRMEVIPPGVDLKQFNPDGDPTRIGEVAQSLDRFLREPEKPMILVMARPDERKNLESAVRVYGENKDLQEIANLVMVMGTREDIEKLPSAQQSILRRVLFLIDKYDLYGKVAYPKSHNPSDVANFYRLAKQRKGVFVNPAFTEPFGLTLLEAGAVGVPIVATNDGGPRDIIANCRNGMLIDVMDDQSIYRALKLSLTDQEQWQEWSENGINNTRDYYSWGSHASKYLRDVEEIFKSARSPHIVNRPARRLPEFDRLIIADLDNTITGDAESFAAFKQLIEENDHIGFGVTTGRRLEKAVEMIDDLGLPKPDLLDTDSGTQLHYGESLNADLSWRKSIGFAWDPAKVRETLEPLEGVDLQDNVEQSEFKIGYKLDPNCKTSPAKIRKLLRAAGVRAKVITSLGTFVDIIPVRGGSDLSLRHVLWKWSFTPENVLVAGDSGNDAGMLLGRTLGVVVANHGPELNRLRNRPRIYFASKPNAGGILEGIEYYNFLGNITIPNDRIE
ncbi:HAD family hydrolase [Mariniblastus fucicola]|uniref:sucrose-phosphate synthase n=1 Tax=Mariniblastus fucicola TaxID=980251 RepID=A0A5B9PKI6_9BACT|nr:HAD family hydrolase [Mariniblastus fucicola]QEG25216.1 Mannosylfructose-phosphate synthase [Mariniblastus fucicola]